MPQRKCQQIKLQHWFTMADAEAAPVKKTHLDKHTLWAHVGTKHEVGVRK